jgi:hypothetical protein
LAVFTPDNTDEPHTSTEDMMRVENTSLALSRGELLVLARAASTDKSRPNLNAVYFDTGSGAVVATDGHAMVIADVPPGQRRPLSDVEPFLLSSAGLLTLVRSSKNMIEATFHRGNDRIMVSVQSRTGLNSDFELRELDASYPPWQDVTPSDTPSDLEPKSIGVDPDFLKLVAMTAHATLADRVACVYRGGELDPFRYDIEGRENCWRIVIMPMKLPAKPIRRTPVNSLERPAARAPFPQAQAGRSKKASARSPHPPWIPPVFRPF